VVSDSSSCVVKIGASESCVGVGDVGADDVRAMVSTREASWSAGSEDIFFFLISFFWVDFGTRVVGVQCRR
jgi:hypothetical protein